MPLYEYQCQSCGDRTEVIQRMSDAPLTTCDDCGGDLKKLISAPAFQFKGSGWYVTDYADKGGGKDKARDSESGDSKAKESSKSESKDSADGSSSKTSDASKAERVSAD